MPDNQRLNYLLHLYLQEKITLAEAEELRIMIKSGYYDEDVKDIIDAELLLESGERDIAPSKSQALLSRIFEAELHAEALLPIAHTRRHRGRWWWIAAALIIIAASCWYAWHRHKG